MLTKGAIMDMIPQIIGLLAVATFLFSYQPKKEKKYYTLQHGFSLLIYFTVYIVGRLFGCCA